jgi:hypothetical protein
MNTLRIVLLGSLIMATPSVLALGVYALAAHVWNVREDRRSLRELREWRNAQRERDRAAAAFARKSWV